MAKVVLILADGFEEVEAVSIVDVLRRAGIEVVMAGLHAGPACVSDWPLLEGFWGRTRTFEEQLSRIPLSCYGLAGK